MNEDFERELNLIFTDIEDGYDIDEARLRVCHLIEQYYG